MGATGLEAPQTSATSQAQSARALGDEAPASPKTSWRRWSWRRPFDYVVAATVVMLAALGSLWLWPYIAPQISPLFFAAVMVAAWFGGLGPGLFATGLAAFLSIYLFTRPFGSLQFDVNDALRLNVFLMVALLTSWLTDRRERAETALREAHAELEDRVSQRTRQLQELNVALRNEVQVRRQTEQHLIEHQQQLSDVAAQLALTEEHERRRFATLLHDDVSQLLALAQMRLEEARQSLDAGGAGPMSVCRENIEKARELLEQGIARARSLTCELSPPILYELGLEAGIEWLVDQMRARTDIELSFDADSAAKPLSEQRSIVLFQSVRELLANCVKHSRAGAARVRLARAGDEIHISVEDDGVGFLPGAEDGSANSFGLFNVRERVGHEGGRLHIESSPGRGSRLVIAAPLQPESSS